MRGLFLILKKLWSLVSSTKLYMPKAFSGMFIIFELVSEGLKLGWREAFYNFGIRLFASEYMINKNVTLALENPEAFGFLNLLDILNSFLVAYFVIKFFSSTLLQGFAGSQAPKGAFLISVIFYFIIEIAVVIFFGRYERVERNIPIINETMEVAKLDFMPIKDGFLYLFQNFSEVIGAVDWLWLKELGIRG